MNNISVNCKVSLSKKLRALIGNEGSVTLIIQNIVDGKGIGILSLASDKLNEQIAIGEETSIMITPIEIASESPNFETLTHASIFTGSNNLENNKVVSKIAAVEPPEKGQEYKAIVKQVKTPKAFKELDNIECKTWIANISQLIEATNKAKLKISSIDPESGKTPRERAVLKELREKEEAIDQSAVIVNDKVSSISINDLDISLKQFAPYDLKNISAKRIAASSELKELLKSGYIKFISPDEKEDYITRIDDEPVKSELQVFDRHEDAEESIASGQVSSRNNSRNPIIDDRNNDEITDGPTEEESMITNLTKNLPTVKTDRALSNGTRHTAHNSTPDRSSSQSSKPQVKTIKKL
jgi:hypothetical protein